MRITTLLNNCYYLKSFVYHNERLEQIKGQVSLVFDLKPRKNSRPICSTCHRPGSVYDHSPQSRLFQFIPAWGYQVYFRYQIRRVNCRQCGTKAEAVPWAQGKHRLTTAYQQFLAHWAKRLSWLEVARSFRTSWDHVFQSVKGAVEYGLQHRRMDNIEAIGIDEIQYGQGHQYLTLVYQIDSGFKRLLYIGQKRTVKSLLRFFHELGERSCERLRFICSDMWKPYLKVIKKKAPQALHILDRFHIVAQLNKAVDEVRRAEAKRLKEQGYEALLKHSKYCFLKNESNLTDKQHTTLNDLLQYDLKSVKAYLLKESFQAFWQYRSTHWAKAFLHQWCYRVMRSKLDPMKKFVGTIRRHEELMMNWFKAKKQYSSGVVEGLNRKVNLVTRKAYGFKSYEVLKIALFHTMGQLPEPEITHRFF